MVRLLAPQRGWSVVLAAVVAALLWGLVSHPSSPLMLPLGDLALGMGDPDIAVARYDAVAAASSGDRARAALSRSATVWLVDLGDDRAAQARLERLAELTSDASGSSSAALADVYDRLARVHLNGRRVDAAAEALHAGALADSSRADLLLRAARLRLDLGHYARADALFARLGERHASQRAVAHLGRAEAWLAQGRTLDALDHFHAARDLARDSSVDAVARLGTSTCYERLGNLEGALAEIDAAELPEGVRSMRAGGIQLRAAFATGDL